MFPPKERPLKIDHNKYDFSALEPLPRKDGPLSTYETLAYDGMLKDSDRKALLAMVGGDETAPLDELVNQGIENNPLHSRIQKILAINSYVQSFQTHPEVRRQAIDAILAYTHTFRDAALNVSFIQTAMHYAKDSCFGIDLRPKTQKPKGDSYDK